MTGHFTLKNANDLLRKLERELDRFKQDPLNPDHAFNFFVTAEHMPEWLCHGDAPAIAALKADPLLKICSHLANNAKHFEVNPARHQAVVAADTRRVGSYFGGGFFDGGYFGGEKCLIVELQEVMDGHGTVIKAIDLAQLVLDYWVTKVT